MSLKLKRILVAAILVIAVLAVYWPALDSDFVNINDFDYVTKNEHINTGFTSANVKWSLTSQVAANWHPVTVLSHMLDCQIYGSKSARGHHLTSLILHLFNVLLLFAVLTKLTAQEKSTGENFWPVVFVTALFALHPMRVESVVWISERKDVLSAFFFLLTIWAYLCYVEKQNPKASYALALIFFALGLMSKPMLVTLPCVLLLLDFWPLKRFDDWPPAKRSLKLFIEKIPFFTLTALLSVVTFLVQKHAGAMGSLEKLSISARVENAMISYARYLEKTFWPKSLSVLYPMSTDWTAWQIAGSLALFLGLSIIAMSTVRRKPYIFVGWFWFVGMLVPVIGLVQVGTQAMADRFTYLPIIGFLIALAWALRDLAARWRFPALVPVITIILALLCLPITARQVGYWKNTKTLLLRTVEVTGKNPRANATLGTTMALEGKTDQAIHYLETAIAEKPDFAEAHGDLAGVYARAGKIDQAKNEYEAALKLNPALPMAHFGLASILLKRGEVDPAVAHMTEALKLAPGFAQGHFQLAMILTRLHRMPEAIDHFRLAVRAKPDFLPALNSLAWNLATQPDAQLRNGAEAVEVAKRAIKLKPDEPGLYDTLGAAYAECGKFLEAIDATKTGTEKAQAAGNTPLAQEMESHVRSYQSQQPWRE